MRKRTTMLRVAATAGALALCSTVAMAATTPAQCVGCFAVVNADGGFNRGKGVVKVLHPNVGFYTVQFNKPVNKCAFQATVGRGDRSFESSGSVQVRSGADNRKVDVLTRSDPPGGPPDRGFHLSIVCP